MIAVPRGVHEMRAGRVQAQANDGHNNLKEDRYGLVQNPPDVRLQHHMVFIRCGLGGSRPRQMMVTTI